MRKASMIKILATVLLTAGLTVPPATGQQLRSDEPFQDIPYESVWTVKTLAKTALPRGVEPSIRFSEAGAFRGFTGCNEVYGLYVRQNDLLRFGDLVLGRKKCGLRVMAVEKRFISFLTRTGLGTLHRKVLRVYDGEGREIATLERAG